MRTIIDGAGAMLELDCDILSCGNCAMARPLMGLCAAFPDSARQSVFSSASGRIAECIQGERDAAHTREAD